jgi:hypothetical protein
MPSGQKFYVPHIPANASDDFKRLCLFTRDAPACAWPSGFIALKGPCLATWANESGWGNSRLARDYNNFAGMKWHSAMDTFGPARPVEYKAWDGTDTYTAFPDWRTFIDGYFHRLDNHPAYAGWRDAAVHGGQKFLEHVAPVWYGYNARAGAKYLQEIRTLWEGRILDFLQTAPIEGTV